MGPIYEHFKFALGDFVQPKILNDARHHHRKMQIIERMYQECPGGVQLHYGCRCSGMIGSNVRFLEIEIEPYVRESLAGTWSEMTEGLEGLKKTRETVREIKKAVDETESEPQ